MQILMAIVAGTLFGAGLTVAQMVDPLKVLNFLDVAGVADGTWDPTLLMVFIGALPTMFLAYEIRRRRMSTPVLAPSYAVPLRTDIDARLVGGSALFGIGWGLVGVCPGPALTSLALAGGQIANVALFVIAMIAGIMLSWLTDPGGIPEDIARSASKS